MKNERQHYVPQFYLRAFSPSENKRDIGVLNVRSGTLIPSASVRGQCQSSYYYGRDGQAEKALAGLEGEFASVLRKITNRDPLSAVELRSLAWFVALQKGRTTASNRAIKQFTEYFRKLRFPDEELDAAIAAADAFDEITPTFALEMHARASAALFDLKRIYLVNKTDVGFITSDNPVIMANPAWPKIGHAGGFGIASAGVMFVTPISPKLALILYDGACYTFGAVGSRYVETHSRRDISFINDWTIRNALQNIYASTSLGLQQASDRLEHLHPHLLSHDANIEEFPEEAPGVFRRGQRDSGVQSSLIVVNKTQIVSPLALSIGRLRERLRTQVARGLSGPLRASGWPELMKPIMLGKAKLEDFSRIAAAFPELPREVKEYFGDAPT